MGSFRNMETFLMAMAVRAAIDTSANTSLKTTQSANPE